MSGGNGGAMGKSKRDTENAAKKNKVVTMPRRDSGEKTKEADKGKEKPSAKKTLRHAANELVKNDSGELADKLLEKAKKGNRHSAEMLLELIEKKRKMSGGDDNPDEPSLAEQLMEGPTWEEVMEARRLAREEEEAEATAS